jgi:hypothetical protein
MKDRKIGLEIENESYSVSVSSLIRHLRSREPYSWEVEGDGSLRGGSMGWEIKTVFPGLPFDRAIASLNELYPCLMDSSGVWRAAVHVHVDCSDLTDIQRAFVLCLAYSLDDSIFDTIGADRKESNFCVPMAHKRWHVMNTIDGLCSGSGIFEGYGKYSSINANSLMRFGTLEFRHMRTPATDGTVASVTRALGAIERYATMAYSIVDSVRMTSNMRTTQHVLDNFLNFVDSGVLVRDGMKHNPEHVYDIVSMWSGHAVLPFELDLASVKKVALPVRNLYPSREEEELVLADYAGQTASFEEFLSQQAEIMREQRRTSAEAETIRSNW